MTTLRTRQLVALGYKIVYSGLIARFWAKVDKRGEGECWPWKGYKTPLGYGTISVGGRKDRVHNATRVMWTIVNGPIPYGLEMCHKCDNPPCINPDHLFMGSHKENYQDALSKGRDAGMFKNGVKHRNAKLTEDQVKKIRAEYIPYVVGCRKLAKQFNVSDETIRRIVLNRSYQGVQ